MLKIKEMRNHFGISQKELANKLYLTNSTISDWERGRTEPNIQQLKKLAEIFNCSIDYILDNENEDGTVVGNNLSIDEQILIDKIRTFDYVDKNIIYKLVDTIYIKSKK